MEAPSADVAHRRYVYARIWKELIRFQVDMDLDGTPDDAYAVQQDGLGTVVSLANAETGALAERIWRDAYGGIYRVEDGAGGELQATTSPIGYTSHYDDAETDLVYMRMRYYDPRNGRFMTRDPAGYPDGPNVYIYARDNPPNTLDHTGLFVGVLQAMAVLVRQPVIQFELRTEGPNEAPNATSDPDTGITGDDHATLGPITTSRGYFVRVNVRGSVRPDQSPRNFQVDQIAAFTREVGDILDEGGPEKEHGVRLGDIDSDDVQYGAHSVTTYDTPGVKRSEAGLMRGKRVNAELYFITFARDTRTVDPSTGKARPVGQPEYWKVVVAADRSGVLVELNAYRITEAQFQTALARIQAM